MERETPAENPPNRPLWEPVLLLILSSGFLRPFPLVEIWPREPVPTLPDGNFQALGQGEKGVFSSEAGTVLGLLLAVGRELGDVVKTSWDHRRQR